MTKRIFSRGKGLRHLLAAAALCLAAGGNSLAGIGHVPKESIVKVLMRLESAGLSIQDRYYPQLKVQEEVELNGFVAEDGYVVSFAGGHVLDLGESGLKRASFSVQTADGKGYPAKLAGVDERLWLVYLKTPLPGDKAVTFSPDALKTNFKIVLLVGKEWKVAEPCLQEQKSLSWLPLTEIQLSGLDVTTSWAGALLVDGSGRVNGLLARQYVQPFSSSVVCEIIPAELLRASFDTVRKSGESVRSGWLGVLVDEDDKRTLIKEVVPDGPAAKAGLLAGDLILAIDGEPLTDLRELGRSIRSKSPGSNLRLEILREGAKQTAWVRMAARPPMEKMGWRMEVPRVMDDQKKGGELTIYRSILPPLVDLGLVLDTMTAQLARKWKSPSGGGLLVKEVLPESSAQKAGFAAGDVIFKVNGRTVTSLSDIRETLEAAPRGPLEIYLVRDGKVQLLKIGQQ